MCIRDRVKTYTLIASTASVPGPFNGASKEVRDMMVSRSRSINPTMDEVYQRELKWVGLIGMEGKEIDTPKFREDTINNYKRIKDITVNVACDVNNPMCGENGASAIFGPQKGASKSDIKMLDSNLLYWSEIIKAQFSKDILNVPGSGAAGGLGGGLMAFVNAQLSSGADIILNSLNYDNKLKGVDLVIVGEGQTDKSTQFNKSPVAVAERAKKLGIPVVCISGSLGDGYLESSVKGIDAFFSIVNKPMSLDIALNNAYDLISKSTKEIYKTLIF